MRECGLRFILWNDRPDGLLQGTLSENVYIRWDIGKCAYIGYQIADTHKRDEKGNEELLSWLNNEIVQLGEENFFHAAYEETLAPVYGEAANADSIVIEGGQLQ